MKNLVKNFSKEFDANYEDSTRPNAKYAKRYSLLSILDQLQWVISTKEKDASKYHAEAEEMISTSAGDTWEEIKNNKVQLVMGKIGETIGASHFDEYGFTNKLEQQATCIAEAEMHKGIYNFFKDVLKTSCQEEYVPKALRRANAMQSKANNNKTINNFQASLKKVA
tara:strand:+ start:47 stop:547 length:501 start_codon:yes stop_codon:yes gene_type:complete